ncbi:HNH endonuclease [Mesotoga sp. H07.pep.5.3]|uniref:HNH endonuclease n=1 Tax=Mesotoga sp. H07.pep.5.3 TaxID=1421003 RepID=UPI000C1A06AD|nr:HNH endonuclease signature motif containing protein [Mesotoga sp. H07.pep.5.3]
MFPKEIVKQAWERAHGKCECERTSHVHKGRCNKNLVWENRGKDGERGAWEAHHRTAVASGGTDTLSNCEILCLECHKKIRKP